jgi:5-methylcytosine-specific restriction endonuclease McrA
MRELVILRDQHCVFPHCTRDARTCDLDHITPYDPEGPPGQTRPHNLAALCRRHHRAKTLGLWRYTRTPTGIYHWTDPHGHTYLVTPHGTRPA